MQPWRLCAFSRGGERGQWCCLAYTRAPLPSRAAQCVQSVCTVRPRGWVVWLQGPHHTLSSKPRLVSAPLLLTRSPARTAVAPSARLPVPWMWASIAGHATPCTCAWEDVHQRSSPPLYRARRPYRTSRPPCGVHQGTLLISMHGHTTRVTPSSHKGPMQGLEGQPSAALGKYACGAASRVNEQEAYEPLDTPRQRPYGEPSPGPSNWRCGSCSEESQRRDLRAKHQAHRS